MQFFRIDQNQVEKSSVATTGQRLSVDNKGKVAPIKKRFFDPTQLANSGTIEGYSLSKNSIKKLGKLR